MRESRLPVEGNPPNWQHGRVIYALARELLVHDPSVGLFVDIGIARVLAVVMGWAIAEAQARAIACSPSTWLTRSLA